jgi:hypothetical protein
VTRGSTQTVTVYCYRTRHPTNTQDGILQCESKPLTRGMQTRYGARPKRVRDSETGPAQASGLAPAAQPDDRQPDETHKHPQVRAQGSALGMPDNARLGPGLASPQPHGATAGAQRAAAGVSPGGRPVAPPGLGRLPVVRGTAAGFALVASQTSRFKQAQACAIVAEKKGILYTAVQIDKSNEPHKQSARPAFGPTRVSELRLAPTKGRVAANLLV